MWARERAGKGKAATSVSRIKEKEKRKRQGILLVTVSEINLGWHSKLTLGKRRIHVHGRLFRRTKVEVCKQLWTVFLFVGGGAGEYQLLVYTSYTQTFKLKPPWFIRPALAPQPRFDVQ